MKAKLEPIIAGLQAQLDALHQLSGDPPDAAIREIAKTFSRMNDDQQARFFNEVAAIMKDWPTDGGMASQAYYIGRHLRTCECSTDEARIFIHDIYTAMKAE